MAKTKCKWDQYMPSDYRERVEYARPVLAQYSSIWGGLVRDIKTGKKHKRLVLGAPTSDNLHNSKTFLRDQMTLALQGKLSEQNLAMLQTLPGWQESIDTLQKYQREGVRLWALQPYKWGIDDVAKG